VRRASACARPYKSLNETQAPGKHIRCRAAPDPWSGDSPRSARECRNPLFQDMVSPSLTRASDSTTLRRHTQSIQRLLRSVRWRLLYFHADRSYNAAINSLDGYVHDVSNMDFQGVPQLASSNVTRIRASGELVLSSNIDRSHSTGPGMFPHGGWQIAAQDAPIDGGDLEWLRHHPYAIRRCEPRDPSACPGCWISMLSQSAYTGLGKQLRPHQCSSECTAITLLLENFGRGSYL
jgi:hypothetical protein